MMSDSVRAEIAFVNDEWRDRNDPPRIYSRASRLANTTRHEVTITSARPRAERGELNLDESGFVLVDHTTEVENFHDKSAVRDVYFPAMRELLLEISGAHDALPIGFYQVRSHDPEHFFNAYSLYMHCDFSPRTWARFAQAIAADAGVSYPAEDWAFACYNLWRPIGGVVERDPLVLIDAATVDRQDIIEYSAVPEGQKGLAAVPLFNAAQRYVYVPQMRPDEVLIFKQLDSRPDRALVCPHTSFTDPTSQPDAAPRQSIDIRFMCVFSR